MRNITVGRKTVKEIDLWLGNTVLYIANFQERMLLGFVVIVVVVVIVTVDVAGYIKI